MRGGPGLGNIAPAQSDYLQIVKGGGHGDYKMIVLAPATVQEMVDLTLLAFDLADRYRIVSVLLADGSMGQMMEGAELPPMRPLAERPDWALTGARGRDTNLVSSIHLDPEEEEAFNLRLQAKFAEIEAHEVRCEEHLLDDARVAVVAFGTAARVAKTAIAGLRAEGVAVGLLRPITLWPYPEDALRALAERVDTLLVVEMNAGQMVEDVRRIVEGRVPVRFYGRTGGVMPMPEEIADAIREAAGSASGAPVVAASRPRGEELVFWPSRVVGAIWPPVMP
jgi:2-oxoglutarate ferredoxin oxidoreductase subunit alpha